MCRKPGSPRFTSPGGSAPYRPAPGALRERGQLPRSAACSLRLSRTRLARLRFRGRGRSLARCGCVGSCRRPRLDAAGRLGRPRPLPGRWSRAGRRTPRRPLGAGRSGGGRRPRRLGNRGRGSAVRARRGGGARRRRGRSCAPRRGSIRRAAHSRPAGTKRGRPRHGRGRQTHPGRQAGPGRQGRGRGASLLRRRPASGFRPDVARLRPQRREDVVGHGIARHRGPLATGRAGTRRRIRRALCRRGRRQATGRRRLREARRRRGQRQHDPARATPRAGQEAIARRTGSGPSRPRRHRRVASPQPHQHAPDRSPDARSRTPHHSAMKAAIASVVRFRWASSVHSSKACAPSPFGP